MSRRSQTQTSRDRRSRVAPAIDAVGNVWLRGRHASFAARGALVTTRRVVTTEDVAVARLVTRFLELLRRDLGMRRARPVSAAARRPAEPSHRGRRHCTGAIAAVGPNLTATSAVT